MNFRLGPSQPSPALPSEPSLTGTKPLKSFLPPPRSSEGKGQIYEGSAVSLYPAYNTTDMAQQGCLGTIVLRRVFTETKYMLTDFL